MLRVYSVAALKFRAARPTHHFLLRRIPLHWFNSMRNVSFSVAHAEATAFEKWTKTHTWFVYCYLFVEWIPRLGFACPRSCRPFLLFPELINTQCTNEKGAADQQMVSIGRAWLMTTFTTCQCVLRAYCAFATHRRARILRNIVWWKHAASGQPHHFLRRESRRCFFISFQRDFVPMTVQHSILYWK